MAASTSASTSAQANTPASADANEKTIPPYAFVTLLTTDSYLPGALVLAHSLREQNPRRRSSPSSSTNPFLASSSFANSNSTTTTSSSSSSSPAGGKGEGDDYHLVCLCTPAQLSVQSIKALRHAFDVVIGVEPLSFAGILRDRAEVERKRVGDDEGESGGGGGGVAGPESSKSGALVASRGKERGDDAGTGTSTSLVGSGKRRIRELAHKNLALLGRPELGEARGAALTKLHAWRLTAYKRVVFLDADMLALGDITSLFHETSPLSASPDIGWPDAFNSGLLSLPPSDATFEKLLDFAVDNGSWDGADQGLLNDFFGEALDAAEADAGGRKEWGSWKSSVEGETNGGALDGWRGPGWKRLSFRYNVTPNGGYTYAPAYQRYGKSILATHFLGANKPWSQSRPPRTFSQTAAKERGVAMNDYNTLLSRWHDVFDAHYGGQDGPMEEKMESSFEVIHSDKGVEVVERVHRRTARKFVVPTYEAVWDSLSRRGGGGQQDQAQGKSGPALTGPGNVDDLKGMFQAGLQISHKQQTWGNMNIYRDEIAVNSTRNHSGAQEAIYFSMPIQGRLSLVPPPFLPWIEEEKKEMDAEEESTRREEERKEEQQQQAISPPHEDSPVWSPTMTSWNPALGPPPASAGEASYQMRNAPEMFYSNVWDDPFSAHQRSGINDLFRTRDVTEERIPAQLQRQGFFNNLGSDRPDPSQVKAIFPWEATRQNAPTRIFPDEYGYERGHASPPGGTVQSSVYSQFDQSERTGEWSTGGGGNALGFHQGLPTNLSYINAWDQDPSIGEYAEHVRQRTRKISLAERQAERNAAVPPSMDDSSGMVSRSSGSPSWRGRAGGSGSNMQPDPYVELETAGEQEEEGDNESSSGHEDEDEEESEEEEERKLASGIATTRRRKSWRRQAPSAEYHRKAEALRYSGHPSSPRSSRFLKLDNVSQTSFTSTGRTSVTGRTSITTRGMGGGATSPTSSDAPGLSASSIGSPRPKSLHLHISPPGSTSGGNQMLASGSPGFLRADLQQIQRTNAQAARATSAAALNRREF